MKVVKLGPTTLKRRNEIERTPMPEAYVDEVEEFLLGRGAATHLHEPGSAILLLDDNDVAFASAIHCQDQRHRGAQYICGIVIDHRLRARGLGRQVLAVVIDDARRRSGHEFVRWLVHPDNSAMLAISRATVASGHELGIDVGTGYIEFVDP